MIKDVYEVMNSLGDEVKTYIEQADSDGLREEMEEKPEPKSKPIDLLEPFKALVGDFKLFFPEEKNKKDSDELPDTKEYREKQSQTKGKLEGQAKNMIWVWYDVFKKANGLLTP